MERALRIGRIFLRLALSVGLAGASGDCAAADAAHLHRDHCEVDEGLLRGACFWLEVLLLEGYGREMDLAEVRDVDDVSKA